jgi:hypothetical protein
MGAIADSSTATWITLNAAAKLQHTTRKSAGVSISLYKDLIPKVPPFSIETQL